MAYSEIVPTFQSYRASSLILNMLTTGLNISSKGQVVIPKAIRDSLHWDTGVELILFTTAQGVMLQTKPTEAKQSAKSLRGSLQYSGTPIPTEHLCKPVDYEHG